MKNIRIILSENFHFLVVKFSIYMNRHVFVMVCEETDNYNWAATWENVPSDVRPTKTQISLRVHKQDHDELDHRHWLSGTDIWNRLRVRFLGKNQSRPSPSPKRDPPRKAKLLKNLPAITRICSTTTVLSTYFRKSFVCFLFFVVVFYVFFFFCFFFCLFFLCWFFYFLMLFTEEVNLQNFCLEWMQNYLS